MTAHSPLRCSFTGMAAPDADGYVVLMDTGNYPAQSSFLNETWTWNGTDWTNTSATLIDAAGPLPGRTQMTFTYDGYNIMLFGGAGAASGQIFDDTWTWNGTVWTKQSPTNYPFGRFGAKAGLVTGTGAVMFGGFGGAGNGVYLNETWVWDGSGASPANSWTQLTFANGASPNARVYHALAGGVLGVVLFGGQGSNSQFNDTWIFNGSTWAKQAPTASPSVRSNAAMTYDVHGGLYVMYGGQNEYYFLPETWTYNGTTWAQVTGAGPSGRIGAQLAYDAQSSRTILFGGVDATTGQAANDTWAFNALALTWTQL